MIDIVTVVFEQDLLTLPAQAQSIERYCQDIGIRNIYVVVNDNEQFINQIDRSWWGTLANRVLIISRSIFSTTYIENGWVSQQALKLMTAAVSYNTWSMVLDAKTIFVKPLLRSELFDEQQRVQVGRLNIFPVFEPSRQIVNQLFGISLEQQLGPGGVPFFMHNQTVRALISKVENQTNLNFPEWFQAQGMLTEFLLYSGFCQYQGIINKLYSDKCVVNVCNIAHNEIPSFDLKFESMQNALTVSIHRNAWRELNIDQRQQYKNFLIDRDIISAWKL